MRTLLTKFGISTAEELAEFCNVSTKTASKWLRRNYKFNEWELRKISRSFGLAIEEVQDYVA